MVIITLLRGLRRKVKTEKLFYFRLLGNYRQVEDNDNNSEHIQRGKNGGKRELSISQNKVNKELILKAIMHQPSTIQNDNNAGAENQKIDPCSWKFINFCKTNVWAFLWTESIVFFGYIPHHVNFRSILCNIPIRYTKKDLDGPSITPPKK